MQAITGTKPRAEQRRDQRRRRARAPARRPGRGPPARRSWLRWARRRLTVATPASAPVSPTARPPAALMAATKRVLMAPASTETTTSSVGASVTRRPSTCRFGMPALGQRRVDLPAAAVDDDQRGRARRRRHAPRRARQSSGRSRAARRRASAASSASQQPRALVEPEHDVQVLHRLAGRALHQVVDGTDDEHAPVGLVDLPADVAEVGVRDVLDLGQRRRRSAARTARRRRRARRPRPPAAAVVPGTRRA